MRGLQREPWGMGGKCSLGSRLGSPLERLEETMGKGRVKATVWELRVGQWKTPADGWGKRWKLWVEGAGEQALAAWAGSSRTCWKGQKQMRGVIFSPAMITPQRLVLQAWTPVNIQLGRPTEQTWIPKAPPIPVLHIPIFGTSSKFLGLRPRAKRGLNKY